MAIGDELRFDYPDNMCFGCSPHNEQGLQLTMTHVGPGAVETTYTAPDHTCGSPGVIHGGVQATMLDEAIGFAVHALHADADSDDDPAWRRIVTTEFDLRYRRPAPIGLPLTIRARIVDVVGDNYLAVAELLSGDVLCTTATAKWRRLPSS